MKAAKRPKGLGKVTARRAGTSKARDVGEAKSDMDEACPSRYYFATPDAPRRPVLIRFYTL